MPEIEQFALDNYKTHAKRIGEKNIISFIAHCDEKGCHLHATITPILEDGRLSAKDMFGGGGTTSNMPWRDKDEDYLHWAWRAMQYAHAKHYPRKMYRKGQGI